MLTQTKQLVLVVGTWLWDQRSRVRVRLTTTGLMFLVVRQLAFPAAVGREQAVSAALELVPRHPVTAETGDGFTVTHMGGSGGAEGGRGGDTG